MQQRTLVAVLAAVTAVVAWRATSDDAPAPATPSATLVLDRVWIDHLPRSERDTIEVFAALRSEGVGIFQRTSMFKGAHELFRFEAHAGELRLVYPQSGERETVRARAWECTEAGMDFCLELEGNSRGTRRYYSLEGWEIEQGAGVRALAPRIDALLATPR